MDENIIKRTCRSLSTEDLLKLCHGDCLVIRIEGFVTNEVLNDAKRTLFFHEDKGTLGHAKEFTRLGIAYAEVRDEEERKKYHKEAINNITRVRESFYPHLSPMDHLRLILDEIWPGGANLLTVDRQKCFVGVCRYLTPRIDLEPHIDNLEWTLPQESDITINYQLSSNIYLQTPELGGELEIWKYKPNENEYSSLKGDRHYGIDRSNLSKPDVVIRPKQGDLFLLNPRYVHAVRPVEKIDRITLSSFIGVDSEENSLKLWS